MLNIQSVMQNTMSILRLLAFALLLSTLPLSAADPTVARNFIRNDCFGASHNLFTELDSGDVVIMEYVMTCSSCSIAQQKVDAMLQWMDKKYPNRIRFYQFAYTNSYDCGTMKEWVSANTMKTIPFDSGASDVAYYGGFGMPTFVIVGGSSHKILFTGIGFATSDTNDMSAALQSHFLTSDVALEQNSSTALELWPNPTHDKLQLHFGSELSSAARYCLTNTLGQVVCDWRELSSQAQSSIDLHALQLSTGNYTLHIQDALHRYSQSFVFTN